MATGRHNSFKVPLCVATCLLVVATLSREVECLSAVDNVDRLEPIVRRSPAVGAPDQFGFSVVLHQTAEPSSLAGNFSASLENTRIVVGAPRGTYPGGVMALPMLPVDPSDEDSGPLDETGLVYQCPLADGVCGPVTGTGEGNDIRLFDFEGNLNRTDVTNPNITERAEQKSGQLMGATLSSNGGVFMACAPRFVSEGTSPNADTSRAQGRCFLSNSRELRNFQPLRPCTMGDALVASSESQCQAGHSATIFESNGESFAVLGGPGSVLGRGRVYSYSSSSNYSTFSSTANDANNVLFRSGRNFVYDGWSVVSGRITSTASKNLISALPRYNGTIYNGTVVVRDLNDLNSIQEPRLEGEQLGEYFGWTMATADLNGDGFDELLVGAPMYSSSAAVEQGRVYVYENTGGQLSNVSIQLFGRNVAIARFGYSIVNLGDISGDDIDDVAISAPYENLDGSTVANGTIYVYYGSRSAIIVDNPDQIITAGEILSEAPSLTELRTFGFSMHSQVDVDGNFYNDLLVGAHASQAAVLLRTMSLADIAITVGTDRGEVQLDVSGETTSSFLYSVCASYTGRGLEGRSLTTDLLVQEVTALNGVQRLFFELDDGTRSGEYRQPFIFESTGEVFCQNLTVYVERISELNDVRTPLTLEAFFPTPPRSTGSSDGSEPLRDLRDSPNLQVSGNNSVEVAARANCSTSSGMEQCLSDLTLQRINITYRDSNGAVSLNAAGDPRENLVAGEASTVEVFLNLANQGNDPAFGSMLSITVPSIFTFARVNPTSLDVTCEQGAEGQQVCGLPSYLRAGGELVLILRFNVNSGLTGGEGTFNSTISIGLPPQTQDRETDTSNNMLDVFFTVVAEADVRIASLNFTTAPESYIGEPVGEIISVSALGQLFVLSLSVTNNGPTDVPRATLMVFLPYQDSNTGSFYYLYPDAITVNNVPVRLIENFQCETTLLNPDNLNATVINERRRRSAVLDETRTKRQDNANSDSQVVDCTPNSASAGSCSAIACTISNFTQFTTYIFALNGNLDERFYMSQTETFTYTAYAQVAIDGSAITEPAPENNAIASSPYTLGLRVIVEDDPFPIWIPIVCAIAAVILLILLIILLYFIGFFRRRKYGKDDKDTVGGDFEVREVGPDDRTEGKPPVDGDAVEPDAGAPAIVPNENEYEGEGTPEKEDVAGEMEEKDPEETSL